MHFSSLLTSAGWCCPRAFFEANRGVRTGLLAAKLGVSPRTVREWRAYWREGRISCEDHPDCLHRGRSSR